MEILAERVPNACWSKGWAVINDVAQPVPITAAGIKLTVDGKEALLTRQETRELAAHLMAVAADA